MQKWAWAYSPGPLFAHAWAAFKNGWNLLVFSLGVGFALVGEGRDILVPLVALIEVLYLALAANRRYQADPDAPGREEPATLAGALVAAFATRWNLVIFGLGLTLALMGHGRDILVPMVLLVEVLYLALACRWSSIGARLDRLSAPAAWAVGVPLGLLLGLAHVLGEEVYGHLGYALLPLLVALITWLAQAGEPVLLRSRRGEDPPPGEGRP